MSDDTRRAVPVGTRCPIRAREPGCVGARPPEPEDDAPAGGAAAAMASMYNLQKKFFLLNIINIINF